MADPIEILCICIGVILSTLMVGILIQTIINLLFKKSLTITNKKVMVQTMNKNKKKQKIHKKPLEISFTRYIRYGTICSLLSYFIGGNISALIAMFAIMLNSKSNSFALIISFIFWIVGRVTMNCVFVTRLKSSFQGTIWMYSQKMFRCVNISLLVILLLTILMIILLIIHVTIWQYGTTLYRNIFIMLFTLIILFDVSLSMLLIYLFQRKVFQLIKSYFISFQRVLNTQRILKEKNLELNEITLNDHDNKEEPESISPLTISNSTPTNDNNNISFSKSLFVNHVISNAVPENDRVFELDIKPKNNNKRMLKAYDYNKLALINSITQYFILICLSNITSLLTLLRAIISATRNIKNTETENKLNFAFYLEFTMLIDAFINSLCLFLHFPFSLRLYKLLCGSRCCLHKMCLLCVGKCIKVKY
eukprot:518555_1